MGMATSTSLKIPCCGRRDFSNPGKPSSYGHRTDDGASTGQTKKFILINNDIWIFIQETNGSDQ